MLCRRRHNLYYATADSDDLARVYRFDLARDSEMISPGARHELIAGLLAQRRAHAQFAGTAAGTTSSRFDVSSPITCIGARQHGQLVSSGAIVTSTCGRWAGSAPRSARRLSARWRAPAGSFLSSATSSLAMACSISSIASSSCAESSV